MILLCEHPAAAVAGTAGKWETSFSFSTFPPSTRDARAPNQGFGLARADHGAAPGCSRCERSLDTVSVCVASRRVAPPSDEYIRQDFPELCMAITRKIVQVKQDRAGRIRSVLKNALAEQPVPTLADLCRRLSYPHSAVLRRHEPSLCDELLSRYRASVAKHMADLEKEATAILGDTAVPTLRAICRRLGTTVPFMNKHFSAVARMIVNQHRRCVSAETANRHELLLQRIPDVAAELHSQGLYPSGERILKRLPERFASRLENY